MIEISKKELLKKFVFLVIIVFSIASCRSKKLMTIGKASSSADVYKKILDRDIDFKWYKIKAKVNVFMDGYSVSGQTEIRMKKDEFIWLNVKKFGMEFGRILIRPDSFFVIDRFNKSYSAKPLDSLSNQYKIPFDFNNFQDILVGNSLIKHQIPVSFQNIEAGILLKTKGDNFKILYKLNSNYRIDLMKLKDEKNNTVDIDFLKYQDQFDKQIPYVRVYSYPDKDDPKYFFKMEIDQIEKDIPLKIKFKIPENYERF